VDRDRDLEPDAVFWHELRGVRVTDEDGRDLGVIRDVYRAGGAEVIAVAGGDVRPFEMPVVRAFIRAWTPREGTIVIDASALGLEPVEATAGDAGGAGDRERRPGGGAAGGDGA
jgi:ribosomal 30S subunit maturation factor RimM